MRIRIFQTYYLEEQQALLSEHFEPLFIDRFRGNALREYEIFKHIYGEAAGSCDAWGVVSWKFERKTPVSPAVFRQFVDTSMRDSDVAFINPMLFWDAVTLNVWEQGEIVGHTDISRYGAELFGLAELPKVVMDRKTYSFCNYFVATKAFWDDYFYVIDSALARLEHARQSNPELYRGVHTKGLYERSPELSHLPFIIERAFSSFLTVAGRHRVTAFDHGADSYHRKFGVEDGDLLRTLSQMKSDGLRNGRPDLLREWDLARQRLLMNELPRARRMGELDDPN